MNRTDKIINISLMFIATIFCLIGIFSKSVNRKVFSIIALVFCTTNLIWFTIYIIKNKRIRRITK